MTFSPPCLAPVLSLLLLPLPPLPLSPLSLFPLFFYHNIYISSFFFFNIEVWIGGERDKDFPSVCSPVSHFNVSPMSVLPPMIHSSPLIPRSFL